MMCSKRLQRYGSILTLNRPGLVLMHHTIVLVFAIVSRFTQNLSVFRRDINDSLKGPNVAASATTVNDMMTS